MTSLFLLTTAHPSIPATQASLLPLKLAFISESVHLLFPWPSFSSPRSLPIFLPHFITSAQCHLLRAVSPDLPTELVSLQPTPSLPIPYLLFLD